MASAGGDWKDFYSAAERGDAPCVRYHLEHGIDVDYQHPEVMQTALFISVLQEHTKVVEMLLEFGANPNLPTELGSFTPLAAARQVRNLELQKLLLAHGATDSASAHRAAWWQSLLSL